MGNTTAAANAAVRDEAVARQAIARLIDGDEAGVRDPTTATYSVTSAGRGAECFLAQRRRLWCPFADVELTPREVVVGDGLVAVRVRLRGLHVGPYAGLEPCGRTIETDEIHIWRLVDGRLIEHWSCRDDLMLVRQMGAGLPGSPDA